MFRHFCLESKLVNKTVTDDLFPIDIGHVINDNMIDDDDICRRCSVLYA